MSRTKNMRARHSLVASLLIVSGLALGGCVSEADRASPQDDDSSLPNAPVGAGGGDEATQPDCSSVNEGCACGRDGEVADCGHAEYQAGDYHYCTLGKATCSGGKWGRCVGTDKVFTSLKPISPGYVPQGVGAPVKCTNNPCDPGCNTIPDNSAGVGSASTDGGIEPTPDGGFTLDEKPPMNNCVGLQCQQVVCTGGKDTTITGKVLDPIGLNPMFNAIVMIPNGPVPAMKTGVDGTSDCTNAAALPKAVSYAYTKVDGTFTLTNAPVGSNIPILIQTGRWRRQLTVTTTACGNLALSTTQTRLPRKKSEGNIPKIAMVTGSCDAMECLMRRIGIDSTEFTGPAGTGRVHMYRATGGGATVSGYKSRNTVLGNLTTLKGYDLVMLPCDCGSEYSSSPSTERNNLKSYADAGGRVFSSHWGREWVEHNATSWKGTAQWGGGSYKDPLKGYIDTSFTRGQNLAAWATQVGVSNPFNISPARYDVQKLLNVAEAQRWVYAWSANNGPGGTPNMVADYTFDTPLGATDKLGRVMYTDMHLSDASGNAGGTFPGNCTATVGTQLSAQEKVAEFLLFDLGGCVGAETPVNLQPTYTAGSVLREFNASCPIAQAPVWHLFKWKDIIPAPPMGVTSAYIEFWARTATTQAGLAGATPVLLASVNTTNDPNWATVDVESKLKAAGLYSRPHLSVEIKLFPSANSLQAPTLLGWQQEFSCVDSE